MFLLAVIVDKLKTLPDEFDRDPTEVLVKITETRSVSYSILIYADDKSTFPVDRFFWIKLI